MANNHIVPYSGGLVAYHGDFNGLFQLTYQLPDDWRTHIEAVYLSGAIGLTDAIPVGIALTKEFLYLCGPKGPIWTLPIRQITEVEATELKDVGFPIPTSTGFQHMVPDYAYGVKVTYKITRSKKQSKLELYTLSNKEADDLANDIKATLVGIDRDDERRAKRR